MRHVMIDLETLNTATDGVILSLGAVRFDLDSDSMDDEGFYASISIESNLEAGRTINEATLLWWFQQSPAAQTVFTEQKQSLETAMVSFLDWFGSGEFVWSNGADFDIPMVAHALRSFGHETPWKFWNARCVRTYKNLPGMRNLKVPNITKHNALSDAIAQARLVQAIQKKLSSTHPMIKGVA